MSLLEAVQGMMLGHPLLESIGPVNSFGESLVSDRQNIQRPSQEIQDMWLSCSNTINHKV